MDSSRPIGVFDSGVGGLTVVRELRSRLPQESIVYFGDTARLPYGTKSAETITRFALQDGDFLVQRGVKMVVVACHSATSVALSELSRRLPVPVVGVIEPGARAVVAATKTGRVAVIGTMATITAKAYERAIRALTQKIEIIAKPTPLFVPLVEEGWLDNEVAEGVVRHYLSGMTEDCVDALLLGCTHFPLLAPVISRVLGPKVQLIDPAVETAATVERLLRELGLLNPGGPGRHRFYLSDLVPNFPVVAARFLGEPLEEVMLASPGGSE
ncbi:MAG: glutamate racemase [candidate division WOR-3 bacterium]